MNTFNLKKMTMELGNALSLERGFNPAPDSNDLKPLRDFTRWLNETPEAQEVLFMLGVEWPTVLDTRKKASEDRNTTNIKETTNGKSNM